MEDWNQVHATVSIDGENRNYTRISLVQKFGQHHYFDIEVLCSPLVKENVWHHEREEMIAMQGKTVVIRMKHEFSGDESIFKGIITSIGMDGDKGVSGTLHYRGYSTTILLESGRTMDSFTDATLGEIVSEVVEKYGNGISIVNNPAFKSRIPYVQMQEESAYEFLRRLAWQYGEWFYYNGQVLYFGNPYKEKDENLVYDIDMDSMHFSSCVAPFHFSRHDYLSDSHMDMFGDDSEAVRGINTYLANAMKTSEGMYRSQTTMYSHTATGHPLDIEHFTAVEKGRKVSSLVWMTGNTKTCRVRIGEPVVVQIPPNMCKRRDMGRYRIVELTHRIEVSGGYANSFKGIPASMEYIPTEDMRMPVAHAMLAEVTDNADPENLGRVQVQFAWQKSRNKTTNWIRVRSLDAGSSETVSKNRGFVFVPEIGDQVMVDFELGDPCRPYVSGSMFHKNNGEGGNADNHIKTIVTRSGHTLEFNDDKNGDWGITLKDANKNIIHINSKEQTIEITAPKTISLNAENIRLNAKEDINIVADGKLDMSIGKEGDLKFDKLKVDVNNSLDVLSKKYQNESDEISVISNGKMTLNGKNTTKLKGKKVEIQGSSNKLELP
jgi:type VI secretion system secreted protein VgrG